MTTLAVTFAHLFVLILQSLLKMLGNIISTDKYHETSTHTRLGKNYVIAFIILTNIYFSQLLTGRNQERVLQHGATLKLCLLHPSLPTVLLCTLLKRCIVAGTCMDPMNALDFSKMSRLSWRTLDTLCQ